MGILVSFSNMWITIKDVMQLKKSWVYLKKILLLVIWNEPFEELYAQQSINYIKIKIKHYTFMQKKRENNK